MSENLIPQSQIDVDLAFDSHKRQAQTELNDYFQNRPFEDAKGRVHSPDGKFVANDYFDQIRESHYADSAEQPYEELSLAELADELAYSELTDDRTKIEDISDVLLDKLMAFSKDNKMDADARTNLSNRVMKLKDNKKKQYLETNGDEFSEEAFRGVDSPAPKNSYETSSNDEANNIEHSIDLSKKTKKIAPWKRGNDVSLEIETIAAEEPDTGSANAAQSSDDKSTTTTGDKSPEDAGSSKEAGEQPKLSEKEQYSKIAQEESEKAKSHNSYAKDAVNNAMKLQSIRAKRMGLSKDEIEQALDRALSEIKEPIGKNQSQDISRPGDRSKDFAESLKPEKIEAHYSNAHPKILDKAIRDETLRARFSKSDALVAETSAIEALEQELSLRGYSDERIGRELLRLTASIRGKESPIRSETEMSESQEDEVSREGILARIRNRWGRVKIRGGLVAKGDLVNGFALRSPEEAEKNKSGWKRKAIIGVVAVAGVVAAYKLNQDHFGLDIMPFGDGDGLDLNPFNNNSEEMNNLADITESGPTTENTQELDTMIGIPDAEPAQPLTEVQNTPEVVSDGNVVGVLEKNGGTIWGDAKSHLMNTGIFEPSNEQIQAEAQRILDLNNLTWDDATKLPVGYKFQI